MSYLAPVKEMLFVMNDLAGFERLSALPAFEGIDVQTIEAVLAEAAKLSSGVLDPLNASGDRSPSVWTNGGVVTSPGFAEAFKEFTRGGWQGLQHPPEYQGQGLPKLVAAACSEMFNASNLSFALCSLLTDGAIEALLTAGTDAQKQKYEPNLISGMWTGTMNLTEPQAGSDLALIRTQAVPQEDGSYRVFGTKIFVSWGEHDMAENIVHLVLARTPHAPPGVKGVSLFVVPKFLVSDDGVLGERNDIQCLSIEHKLGIKASPTAVLQFGDNGGAIGHIVGAENHGLEYMFIMMNAARFGVGIQGVGVSNRAYQRAVAFSKDRVQSRPVDGLSKHPISIINHPDVRRMLTSMRAVTEAARAVAYVAASHCDLAHHHEGAAERVKHQAIYEFLVPIVKGWSTELAVDVASLGVQVHGGMGFIEETGAAQYYRHARILSIYEGTTAIQANDLVGRKTLRDDGAVAWSILAEMADTIEALRGLEGFAYESIRQQLSAGHSSLTAAVNFVSRSADRSPNEVYAGSVPYLKLAGIVIGGWQMARALIIALKRHAEDPSFFSAKIATAQFYAEHILSQAKGLEASIVSTRCGHGMLALAEDQF